jgi:fatty-acyl-CoA synthase
VNPAAKIAAGKATAAKAWARALELTAPIAKQPERIFSTVIDELSQRQAEAPALLSDRNSFTFGQLAARSNQYARWALRQNIGKGDAVALMMPNQPEYFAAWLGIGKVGGVTALINTNLRGASLQHCVNTAQPKRVIVAAELAPAVWDALPDFSRDAIRVLAGGAHSTMDRELEDLPSAPLSSVEQRPVTIADRALYIYTSGTTGLPKAANVSHARIMQWSHWFAGMLGTESTDRMYNCLPMYHSVGGVQAPGAVLAAGGAVVIAEKFSATKFWSDVVRWDCTLIQYIGELCRYLVNTPASELDTAHHVRAACGNGLRPDVWAQFQERFQIPSILEFYAATEGGLSLFNAEGRRGSIGRVPGYLAHRYAPTLVRFDVAADRPYRDEQGFCVRCTADEIGEAITRDVNDPANLGSRFEGYTSPKASEKRILRDVFELGDAWVRTGDLMRKDDAGFFYFVDRIGDTFRWKGENVATSEVENVLCEFPGVRQAIVYGVAIPGADGRVGMATLVAAPACDLDALAEHLTARLPHYARPAFLRIRNEIETTGTFKYAKTDLARQAYDPESTGDALYFRPQAERSFLPLDAATYRSIEAGEVRF